MPTRRARTVESDPIESEEWRAPVERAGNLPATIAGDDAEPEVQSPVERIASMLSDVSADDRAYIKVSRENSDHAYEFCEDYKLGAFESGGLSMIRRQWGPGYYKLTLYGARLDKNGRPVFGIVKREHVHISALAPGAEPPPSAHTQSSDPNAPPAWLPLLLERLTPPPAQNASAQLKETLALMVAMREAMGLTGQQPQKSTIGEVVDAVRELRGVAGELNGQAPKDDEPSLMQLGAQILELVKAHQTTAPVQPITVPPSLTAPPVSLAGPSDANLNPQPDVQADSADAQPNGASMNVGAMILMGHLNVIVKMGADGKTIDEAVQYIVDKVPDEALDLIELDNWDQMLLAALPAMAPHMEWLGKVRAAALQHPDLQVNEGERLEGGA